MQYYESYQEESSPRIVVPQVFQTINIGLMQPFSQSPSLSHSGFSRPMLQRSHNSMSHHMIEPRALALSHSKELCVIDQSQELQKRKAVSLEVATMYVSLLSF